MIRIIRNQKIVKDLQEKAPEDPKFYLLTVMYVNYMKTQVETCMYSVAARVNLQVLR